DVALIVIDFVPKEELQEAQMLWNKQIEQLLKSLGS
ncbi:MAG: SRPBCC domain-containing protein, partial [Flavobacteriales bacterium]|nr:SRPBCC domain-containing protein [Flavobacteriales bacterium]